MKLLPLKIVAHALSLLVGPAKAPAEVCPARIQFVNTSDPAPTARPGKARAVQSLVA